MEALNQEKLQKLLDEQNYKELYDELSHIKVEGLTGRERGIYFFFQGKLALKKGDFDKARQFLQISITHNHTPALIRYAIQFDSWSLDLQFLQENFRKFDNGDRSASFYAYYAHSLYKLACITTMSTDDMNLIGDLFDKAYKMSPDTPKLATFMIQYYKDFPKMENRLGPNAKRIILQYYIKAAELDPKRWGGRLEEYKKNIQALDLSFDFMNVDVDLSDLINRIKLSGIFSFSMLVYGPNGSGQEEFVKKLLDTLELRYREIKSSSPLTFGTDQQAVILYDDGTYFSQDKRAASEIISRCRSEMKKLKYPLIVITNNIAEIDKDFQNDFTFRIGFSYMEAKQKRNAFKSYFNMEAPERLDRIAGLVLKDFDRIKLKAKILGELNHSDGIMKLIEDDARFKMGNTYLMPDQVFNTELVQSDTNLDALTKKLSERPDVNFNMLVYGPAGTGKSYYLRYLAGRMGLTTIERTAADLFSSYIGEAAKNVAKMFREAEEKKAMIIFDEAEEVLLDRSMNQGSSNRWKFDMVNAFLTNLENAKYPVVCTTNFIDRIDKAILRRFVFKIKFDYLTKDQRRYAFKHFFNLEPPQKLDEIGGLTNGDFATVKKKAALLEQMDDVDILFEMLKEESQKKSKSIIKQQINLKDFDMKFVNTDTALLEKFIKNIKKENKTQFSFLLHGPSGTGKSYYLRHIAQELGYEVIERRSSDIMSKWAGETEQNIAAAFQEAKDRKAFLIFDEIDGVLINKAQSSTNTRDAQVNEFLVQMENHPYPFAGTTNYLKNIEPAALRRFSIKALFDYLKPEQYDYVFEKIFGFKPTEDLGYLKNLTPALFVNAYNKADLAEILTDAQKCTKIFLEETEIAGNKKKDDIPDKTFELLEIEQKPLYKKPIADMYPHVLKGFVKIYSEDMMSHGSGFFITKDGFILTNKHVVGDNKTMIIELFSGRQVPAEVLRTNSLDVALLKISDKNLCTPMPLRLEEPNPGTTIFSMGNPHDKEQVLTQGSITRYTFVKNGPRIEADNLSRGGVSGGPLMDEFGNVIGLNVSGWLDADSNYKTKMGLALQIPIIPALEALNIKFKNSKN